MPSDNMHWAGDYPCACDVGHDHRDPFVSDGPNSLGARYRRANVEIEACHEIERTLRQRLDEVLAERDRARAILAEFVRLHDLSQDPDDGWAVCGYSYGSRTTIDWDPRWKTVLASARAELSGQEKT